jgi:hypothetical protein
LHEWLSLNSQFGLFLPDFFEYFELKFLDYGERSLFAQYSPSPRRQLLEMI